MAGAYKGGFSGRGTRTDRMDHKVAEMDYESSRAYI
jgi:hypothetical protein